MEWNMPGKWRYPTEALWSDEKNQGVVLSADCHRHVMWFGTKHLNFLASVWHSKKWRKIIKITKDFLIANIYYSKLTFSGNTQSHTHKVDFFFFLVQIIHIIFVCGSGSVDTGMLCLAATVYHFMVQSLSTYCLPGKEKVSKRKLFKVIQASCKKPLKIHF